MRTLTQFIESYNSLYLEYKVVGDSKEHKQVGNKNGAITFLQSLKDLEYAYLFKARTTNTSEVESLEFWYSIEDSNNYWNNVLKSNGLKDSIKRSLEQKRIDINVKN